MKTLQSFKRMVAHAREILDVRQINIPRPGKNRDVTFTECYESVIAIHENKELVSSADLQKTFTMSVKMIEALIELNKLAVTRYDNVMAVVDDVIEFTTKLPSDVAQQVFFELKQQEREKALNELNEVANDESNTEQIQQPDQQPQYQQPEYQQPTQQPDQPTTKTEPPQVTDW